MSDKQNLTPRNDHGELHISLAAVQANYQFYADQIEQNKTQNTKIAAVVKADAYGLGMAQIAPALAAKNCRHFFVAQAQEGAALRLILADAAPEAEIYVFNSLSEEAEPLFKTHNLRPCLNSVAQAHSALAAGITDYALFFDTGFNRLGLTVSDIGNLPNGLQPQLIMSHLACADNADHPMNQQQLEMFQTIARHFPDVPKCLANSAGVLLGPDYHFDMVRVGIGLYGGSPTSDGLSAGQSVATLTAPILQIREVKKGQTIGYGADYTAQQDTQIAILGLGYADGYPRRLGRRNDQLSGYGDVAYQGQICPLIGRVSMDLLAIDISHLDTMPNPGDAVEMLGKTILLDHLAQQAETISYEVLTQLGSRFKRVYDKS